MCNNMCLYEYELVAFTGCVNLDIGYIVLHVLGGKLGEEGFLCSFSYIFIIFKGVYLYIMYIS